MNPISETADRPLADASRFARLGFEIVRDVLPTPVSESLAAELSGVFERQQIASRTKIGGVRNLLRESAQVFQLATSPLVLQLVERFTGREVFPVRAIFFDKTAESNWRVPWHQDLTIAVAARIETSGFGPWSVKKGVVHVQPSLEILENMIAIRLHIDDCDEDNGALRVIPGSHLKGELSSTEIETLARQHPAVTCEVPRGGALVMRLLLLHASSPAKSASHRRVLHLEYAGDELPGGLKWLDR